METKAVREANLEATKWRQTLQDDFVKLKFYKTQLKKLERVASSLKEGLVPVSGRHEFKARVSFSECYLLNIISGTGKLINNIDKMMETVKKEQERWKTRNLYLVNDSKQKLI